MRLRLCCRSPEARKRLAVPFRSAHTPAERSEFAHPDISLLLTSLSYAHTGLQLPEFEQALQVLLAMGPNAQRAIYGEWLDLSRPGIPAGAHPAWQASASKLWTT